MTQPPDQPPTVPGQPYPQAPFYQPPQHQWVPPQQWAARPPIGANWAPQPSDFGPMDLYLSSGRVPEGRTAEILGLAQQSHDDRLRRRAVEMPPAVGSESESDTSGPPPPPTPSKHTARNVVLPALLVLAALLIAGAITGIIASQPRVATTTSTGDVVTPVEEHGVPATPDVCGFLEDLCATTEPAVPAVSVTPKAADIKLTAKITDKQCFGSAGCLITFKVNMAYSGPDLSTDDTWEVTYEVTGIKDGPMIGSFDITGDTYDVNEVNVDTTSSKKKISIKVTGVDKVGI